MFTCSNRLLAALVWGCFSFTSLLHAVADEPHRPRPDRPEPARERLKELERREQEHRRWEEAGRQQMRAEQEALEDRARMVRVQIEQLLVAGEERQAAELKQRLEAHFEELRRKREALEAERAERAERLGHWREELLGRRSPRPEDPAVAPPEQSFRQAIEHLQQAAEHLKRAGLSREAAHLGEQRERLIAAFRERTRDRDRVAAREPDRPQPPGDPRTERLLHTIERLNERLERMEREIGELREGRE